MIDSMTDFALLKRRIGEINQENDALLIENGELASQLSAARGEIVRLKVDLHEAEQRESSLKTTNDEAIRLFLVKAAELENTINQEKASSANRISDLLSERDELDFANMKLNGDMVDMVRVIDGLLYHATADNVTLPKSLVKVAVGILKCHKDWLD